MERDERHSISFFVMNKPLEDDNIFFYPEQQDEMTDNSSHHLLNSSKVIGFLLPDLSSFNTSSVDLTTTLASDALTSLSSSSAISDIRLKAKKSSPYALHICY